MWTNWNQFHVFGMAVCSTNAAVFLLRHRLSEHNYLMAKNVFIVQVRYGVNAVAVQRLPISHIPDVHEGCAHIR